MKYRRKPVVYEAFRWSIDVEPQWWLDAPVVDLGGGNMGIQTLEGMMTARPGDWIVRGLKGELWPVKHDVFSASYEPVEVPE